MAMDTGLLLNTKPQIERMNCMNEIVWNTKLDGRFEVVVTRTVPYQGELTISENDQVIFRQPVGLMYDAMFGPDMADVSEWKHISVTFVDSQKA
jgi:hypothetical protein